MPDTFILKLLNLKPAIGLIVDTGLLLFRATDHNYRIGAKNA